MTDGIGEKLRLERETRGISLRDISEQTRISMRYLEAIETDDPVVIKRLHDVVQKDWEASRKLDLSDEGLLADLEKRGKGGAEELVLGDGR